MVERVTKKIGQRPRRTQEERTAQTRSQLIEATISAIFELGYAGANTSIIAERAGVSRGAMLHHFRTRTALMAEVVRHVFETEMAQYEATRTTTGVGDHLFDWPGLLWDVLRQPAGIAVLEILQATRSEADLATDVVPMQEQVESAALEVMRKAFGGSEETARALMRLMVWTARGLSIAGRHLPDHPANEAAIALLAGLIRHAAPSGDIGELARMHEQPTQQAAERPPTERTGAVRR